MSEPCPVDPTSPVATSFTTATDVDSTTRNTSSTDKSADRLNVSRDEGVQAAGVPPSCLWLTWSDQQIVFVSVTILLMLSGYHWATLGGWGMRPIEVERLPEREYDFRIDVNSATWVEWTQIEGIGESTAQKIIADRDANGPFRKIDDLLRVKGIGPKKLEAMRPFLRDPNETSANAEVTP